MKYINDIIKSNNIKNIKMSNGKTLDQMLLEQAAYLQELIEKYLRDYQKAFKPKNYRRTGDLEKSVKVSAIKNVGGVPTVYVYFDENAIHRSGFGVWAVKDGHGKYDDDIQSFDSKNSVNTAILINQGYVVQKPVWFKDYENFGFRGGNGFIDRAIMEFNRTNALGMVIDMSDIIQGNTRLW